MDGLKKFVFQLIALIIVIFAGLYLTFNRENQVSFPDLNNLNFNQSGLELTTLKIGSLNLEVEIADDQTKRAKGLSGRDSLASNSGMLFIFDKEDKYQFWMKGMKFGLDFIWIRGAEVVDIHTEVQAPFENQSEASFPIYQPRVAVDKMLEVNSGFAARNGIKVGDKVEILNSKL